MPHQILTPVYYDSAGLLWSTDSRSAPEGCSIIWRQCASQPTTRCYGHISNCTSQRDGVAHRQREEDDHHIDGLRNHVSVSIQLLMSQRTTPNDW